MCKKTSENPPSRKTLEKGLSKFDEILSKNSKVFSGADIFKLYDTYGFPVDLTKLLCKERKVSVEMDEFEALMEEQKNKARSSAKFVRDEKINWSSIEDKESQFVGYDSHSYDSKIISYSLSGDYIYIQLDKTPFYFESGGQVADTGRIHNKAFTLKVLDVQKVEGRICHITRLHSGEFDPERENVFSEIMGMKLPPSTFLTQQISNSF